MANFSTNQNRQLYVVNTYVEDVTDVTSGKGVIGTAKASKDKSEVIFSYKGADSTMQSDRIPVKNITHIKVFKAADLQKGLKKVKVTLNGALVENEEYVLGILFRQWVGIDERHQYYKDAAVRVTEGMDVAAFWEAMKNSLDRCFAREIGATKTSNPYLKFEVDTDGLIITELEQSWTRGVERRERVLFDVIPGSTHLSDKPWGNVNKMDSTTFLTNGKDIADLEYFCMGERGDQYRMVGWPNVVHTEYLVTDVNAGYNVIEIHYAFTDEGVNSYRSEKDITIVSADAAELNKFIKSFNALGVGITLDALVAE